jgi:MFS family permease
MFRGWLVVAASFCVYLSIGISFSYSEFFLPLAKEFSWNYSTSSWIPGISSIASTVGSLVAGFLVSRLGYRRICFLSSILIGGGTLFSGLAGNFAQLLLTFGILASVGNAFMLVASTSLVINWFVKRRGIAVGIMSSGSGAGAVLVPLIANYFIQTGGWREAFFAIGLFFLILLGIASHYLQMPEDSYEVYPSLSTRIEDESPEIKALTLRKSLLSRKFWILYVMLALGTFGAYVFSVHVVPYAESYRLSIITGTEALALFGIGSLCSRLIMGAFTDIIKPPLVLVLSFGIELASISVLSIFPNITWLFLLGSLGIGFAYGGFIAEFVVLVGDLFGMRLTAKVWGIFETALGLGGLVGPITAGIMFDAYGSYALSFQIASLAVASAFALSLLFLHDTKNLTSREFVLS